MKYAAAASRVTRAVRGVLIPARASCAVGRVLASTSAFSTTAPVTSAAADIKSRFDEVCRTKGPQINSSGTNEQKLRAYSLFKQATAGDASGDRPGMTQFVARAKFDTWAKLKGMSSGDAMAAYVKEFGGDDSSGDTDMPATPVDKYNPKGAFLPIMSTPMLPPGTFEGKVALVTGGGTGLGFATARQLSRLGATVAIMSRKQDVLDAAAKAITAETGKRVLAVASDVRDADGVKAAVDKVVAEAGVPDICMNNAAGNFISPFERLTPNGFKTIVDIVLNGT